LSINKTNFPKWFVENMDFHAKTLKTLVKLRNKADYGYVNGLTKEDFKEDAYEFQDPINKIINDCETLINDFSKKALKG
jgi:hypothetical protein